MAGKGIKIVAGLLVAACLAGNLGLGAYQISTNKNNAANVNSFIDGQLKRQAEEEKKENEYKEDGFVVGESYEIRSTKEISDAYISGDDSKLSGKDKETLELAKKVIDEVITKKCKTNYDKELAIYRWMVENIGHGDSTVIPKPGTSDNAYTPNDVLNGGGAVCVGYATTFRMFMNMLGMDCHIVHNDYHSWDLVELEKGQWYHVDVYSDAGNAMYKNFNMTDDVCSSAGHEWDKTALPEANSAKYSYAVQNAKYLKDIYKIPKTVSKMLKKKKSDGVYYKFKKKLSDKQVESLNVMFNYIQQVTYNGDYENYSISASWYDDGNDGYVLAVFVNYYGSSNDNNSKKSELKKEDYKKIDKALEAAFGGSYDTYAESGNDGATTVTEEITTSADGNSGSVDLGTQITNNNEAA